MDKVKAIIALTAGMFLTVLFIWALGVVLGEPTTEMPFTKLVAIKAAAAAVVYACAKGLQAIYNRYIKNL